jgi:hypothetical protein
VLEKELILKISHPILHLISKTNEKMNGISIGDPNLDNQMKTERGALA